VILFADGEGPSVLQGGQYAQVQFDEQIREDFLGEALKRTETVPHAGIIVTETPLHGRAWWTHTILTRDANAGVRIGDSGAPLVSLHTIDQFAAGMTSHELIRASMQLMPAAEIEARVWGRPAAFKETGVFDSGEITLMLETATLPTRGDLWFVAELKGEPLTDVLHRLEPGMPVEFHG
jgi:hypothetical protein